MEFNFNINVLLKDEITVVDRNNELLKNHFSRSALKDNSLKDQLREVINKIGYCSAKAQNLNVPITSVEQLASAEQRCYILRSTCISLPNGSVLGLLKVGPKRLFFVNLEAQQVEVTPICVLDFYIHESCQRQGYGLKLFNFMLQREGITSAGSLAIDRPSDKMLSFYRKRFNLASPIKQPNNFVVFRDFFKNYTATSSKRWTDHQKRGPIMLKAINQRKPKSVEEIEESKPPTVNSAPDFQLPNVLDRPLSSLVSIPTQALSDKTTKQPTSNRNQAVSSAKSYLHSRERSFSWTRHNINSTQNYVVGGMNNSILQSRYTQYNRPRPF